MQTELKNIDEAALVQIAAKFARVLTGGEVINLHGDVGAGKTTFTRALAQELGVSDPVQSPTFTIANHYETANGLHLGSLRLLSAYRPRNHAAGARRDADRRQGRHCYRVGRDH